jgi:hypothetical protein
MHVKAVCTVTDARQPCSEGSLVLNMNVLMVFVAAVVGVLLVWLL